MKAFYSLLTVLFFLFYCSSQNSEQIVKLKPVPFDSISIEGNFLRFSARPIKNDKYKEKINKFAPNLKVEAVYQFHNLQETYQLASYILNDQKEKERYLKEFGKDKLKFLESLKRHSPFDCTISACMVKDEKGTEYFIFDKNNDEDFTNDPILKFQKSVVIKNGDTLQAFRVHGHADIEYFDGQKVDTKNIGIIFERKPTNLGFKEYWMFDSIPYGTIQLKGEKYPLILVHLIPKFDYYKFDFVSIDLNKNSKFENLTDYFQQIYLPFTYKNTSYKISELDPYGTYIKIKRCDQRKIPPIAVGLSAPDFTVTTSDSSQIHLHDLKGHYVLLGFWSCNSQYCISRIGEMLGYAQKGLKIINFTYSENFDRFLDKGTKKTVKNLAIVKTDVLNPVRKLYQVGSENASILIDKQGKIAVIEKFTYDKINRKLKEIFDQ